MDINQIADMVEISRGRIEEHAPPSATDYALVDLWDEYQALKAQPPQWITVKEAAALPDIVGKRVQIQAVIVEADRRDRLIEIELDSGRWLVIGSTKVAVIE